jgi:AbrB family looped-hinge helix DNA binding protein
MVKKIVKLNGHNQMVLPKAAREALRVKPGGCIVVVVDGQDVRLLPEPESQCGKTLVAVKSF